MAGSTNHHFSPQFYLRGFATPETRKKSKSKQKVWVISKTPPFDCGEKLIKDVGFEEHFHTVTKSDGSVDSNSVEHQIGELERIYAPVRKKILDGCKIDQTERRLLSQFVCLMQMRTPAEKAAIDEMRLAMAQQMNASLAKGDRLEKLLSELPQTKDFPAPAIAEMARRIRKAIVDGRVTFTNPNAPLLNLMFGTAFNPKLVTIYDNMQLEILKAPLASVFITGDQPVVRFDSTPAHLLKPGTGLDNPLVEVTFPLSAAVLLRFSWRYSSAERLITADEVVEFNRRTVIMARKFLFASRSDHVISQLVRDNYGHAAGPRFAAIPLAQGTIMNLSRMIPVRPAESYEAGPRRWGKRKSSTTDYADGTDKE